MDEKQRLRLTGFRDAARVAEIVDASLVDVAYVDEVASSEIFLTAEDQAWLANEKDRAWLKEVIAGTLAQWGVQNIRIELERCGS